MQANKSSRTGDVPRWRPPVPVPVPLTAIIHRPREPDAVVSEVVWRCSFLEAQRQRREVSFCTQGRLLRRLLAVLLLGWAMKQIHSRVVLAICMWPDERKGGKLASRLRYQYPKKSLDIQKVYPI